MNFDSWRHQLRARFFKTLRQPDKAIAEYELALGFDPDCAPAWHRLALAYGAKGATDDAMRCLRRVLELNPGDAIAWYNLGHQYERQHHTDKAIEALREAVRLDPKLDHAWYGLGLALTARGDHAGAVTALEQVILLDPRNSHAWYQLGLAHHANHNPDRVKYVIEHLNSFARHAARRLILDAERSDLAHLVQDLREVERS